MSAPTYNVYHYYYTCITMYQICTCIYLYCYRLRIMSNRHVEVIITELLYTLMLLSVTSLCPSEYQES